MKVLATTTLLFGLTFYSAAQLAYPPTRTVDSTDTYWGMKIHDPYRWLENIKDKEVEDWFKAQADFSNALLNKIPARDALVKEWIELDKLKPATYASIVSEGGRLFYKKTKGGENVGKLYYREGWNGEEKLLFDPSAYKAGVTTTIQAVVPSYDGKRIALGLSASGAEVSELRVLNVDSGTLAADSIYPSWFGPIGWTLDNQSFFYFSQKTADNKSAEFELNTKTKLHRVGADPATDRDFFSNEACPGLNIAPNELPFASIDKTYPEYVFASLSNVRNEMRVFYAPASQLEQAKLDWKVLCEPSDSLVRGMEYYKDKIYAVTLKNAPQYKLVSTDVAHPDWNNAVTIITEQKDAIQYITKTKSFLFVVYSNGITNRFVKYNLTSGQSSEVKLPGSGNAGIFCPDQSTDR